MGRTIKNKNKKGGFNMFDMGPALIFQNKLDDKILTYKLINSNESEIIKIANDLPVQLIVACPLCYEKFGIAYRLVAGKRLTENEIPKGFNNLNEPDKQSYVNKLKIFVETYMTVNTNMKKNMEKKYGTLHETPVKPGHNIEEKIIYTHEDGYQSPDDEAELERTFKRDLIEKKPHELGKDKFNQSALALKHKKKSTPTAGGNFRRSRRSKNKTKRTGK